MLQNQQINNENSKINNCKATSVSFSQNYFDEKDSSFLDIWFTITTINIIKPTTISCQKACTFIRISPLRIVAIIRTPPSVPITEPAPPIKDVPPTTTAATASSKLLAPKSPCPASSLELRIIPERAPHTPLITKARTIILLTRTPESSEASRFPPTA